MLDFVNRPVFRLLLVGIPALALQTTFLADASVAGVVLQLMLCLVAAAGISGGPERGAMAGFVLGLLFDLVLSSPLGLTALVYGLVGFLAGYVFAFGTAHPWWLDSIVVAVATAAATFVHPVVATWVGVDGWLSTRLLKVAGVLALANALLAPLAVPLMRWALAVKRRDRLAPPRGLPL